MRGAGCCFFVLFFLQRSSMDASRDPLICHRISAFTQLSITLYGGIPAAASLQLLLLLLSSPCTVAADCCLLPPSPPHPHPHPHPPSNHRFLSSPVVEQQRGRAGGESGEREPRRRAPADGHSGAARRRQQQHAHPGQDGRGRVHGWDYDRGELRWGREFVFGFADEISLHETWVPGTVRGWNRVLRGPHSAAHPHPEGNQEITVGHRIRWVSNAADLKAAPVFFVRILLNMWAVRWLLEAPGERKAAGAQAAPVVTHIHAAFGWVQRIQRTTVLRAHAWVFTCRLVMLFLLQISVWVGRYGRKNRTIGT